MYMAGSLLMLVYTYFLHVELLEFYLSASFHNYMYMYIIFERAFGAGIHVISADLLSVAMSTGSR